MRHSREKEGVPGMKKLVILGSGTGGTIIAAKMRQKLLESKWEITIIDRDWQHHYQPGWLFIPFGIYTAEDCVKPKIKFIPPGVNFVLDEVTGIDPEKKQVKTKRDTYPYDWLVVATGCGIMPGEVEGMSEGMGKDIHNFYTQDGAVALYEKMKYFDKGRVVINIAEMPIKCPVAPLEFAFMSDWFFTTHGVRDNIEIELVTPLSAAFTKPVAAEMLGNHLRAKEHQGHPQLPDRRGGRRAKRSSNPMAARRSLTISWWRSRPISGPSASSTAAWAIPWAMWIPTITP